MFLEILHQLKFSHKLMYKIFVPFLFFFFNASSQSVLDSAQIRCLYKLTFLTDSTNPEFKRSDLLYLLIGEKASSFFSYVTYKADSAFKADIESGKLLVDNLLSDKNLQKKYTGGGINSKYNIYVDRHANKIFTTDKIGSRRFYYDEKIDSLIWEIFTDTCTILKYICQKAKTSFRGRNYIAWFTTNIPVNAGPYKFNGLPGLIVRISDTRNNFIFECVSIEKLLQKIPIQIDDANCIKTTRAEFRKAFKAQFDNPWESLQSNNPNVTFGGKDMDEIKTMLRKAIPYNPIELE